MSIQPICRRPEDLAKFTYKEFDNKFFKFVKRLAKKHTDLDTAAPCYLSLKENFADTENKFFLVFGKLAKWKAYAKLKAQSTEALYGICYITQEQDSSALIINIAPIKGKIKNKPIAINKALKGVISPSRCKIELLQVSVTDATYESIQAKTEAMEEIEDNEEEEEENIGAEAKQGNIPSAEQNTTANNNTADNTTPREKNAEANNNAATTDKQTAEETANDESQLSPAQAKKIATIRADIADIKVLLDKIENCQTKAELKALDEELQSKFAPYGSKKTN